MTADVDNVIDMANEPPRQIAQPKCPRCYKLLEFLCNVVRTPPGHLIAIVWCGNCGHTLQTQFIGMDEPQGPRIVRPS
jgi:hypothetical protein